MYRPQIPIKKPDMTRSKKNVRRLPPKTPVTNPILPTPPQTHQPLQGKKESVQQDIRSYAQVLQDAHPPSSEEIVNTSSVSAQTMSKDSVTYHQSAFLTKEEGGTWQPPVYRELILPAMWKEDNKVPFGLNRIAIRGAIVSAPSMVNTGKDKTLRLSKVLVKIWNSYQLDGEMKQSQTATIFVVGFEDVAEALQKFQVGDLIEVSGVLSTRAYMRKITMDEANQFEVKTYDTTLIARAVIKFLDTNLMREYDEWEIPEEQSHDKIY